VAVRSRLGHRDSPLVAAEGCAKGAPSQSLKSVVERRFRPARRSLFPSTTDGTKALALIDLVEQPRDIGTLRSHPDVVCSHPNSKFYLHQGGAVIERNITLPEMILWTGTRVALGAGIGMLISRRLSKDAMKAAGLALTVVGGLTTIPLAISIMGKKIDPA